MGDAIDAKLDELNTKFEELLFWTRMSAFHQTKAVFESILDDPNKRRAYQLTDGNRTVDDIKDAVGVGKGTVHRWWKDWESKGIVVESPAYKGRKAKIIDLDSLGIGAE